MVWKPDFQSANKEATERRRKRFGALREETKNIQLMNFMGGELVLPETEGASPAAIEQSRRAVEQAVSEATATGGLA